VAHDLLVTLQATSSFVKLFIMKYRFGELFGVGGLGVSSVELFLSHFSTEVATFRLSGSWTVGSITVGEDDASVVATIGVRVGDDFRNRQTNRTFLNAEGLVLGHWLWGLGGGRYFYR
jgi:hypothetical protein